MTISTDADTALRQTGFVICTFPPDDDECEKCGEPFKQHYFRSIGGEYPDDGDYYCLDCVIALATEIQQESRCL